MSVAPTCPRCRRNLAAPGLMHSAWACAEHGEVAPLNPARPGTSEQIARIAERSKVPVWLPWPLPVGWLVTGVMHAGDDRTGAVASVVALSGPNPLPGHAPAHMPTADLLLIAEQPAVGLGASLAGLTEVDPGDSLSGALLDGCPQAKVYAAGHPAPLWCVPAESDRAAYVGEAHGDWLWMVMWPASAGAMVLEGLRLIDVRDPGHPLDVPTGAPSPHLT
ncbi:MAG: DUF6758 family protein [Actinomycetales bacterium]